MTTQPQPKRIPLYDDTVPVACSITSDEIPGRIELLERMRASVATIDRTPTGLLLHFPARTEVRSDLATFAIDEKRCCQFWGFDTWDDATGIAFRWDGPPGAAEILDRLEAFLKGDQTISILDGLL